MKNLLLLLLLTIPPALAFGLNAWISSESQLPPMGVVDGELLPCPPGVDCLATSEEGLLAPLPFTGDPEEARDAMIQILRTEGGAEYVEFSGDYIHLVFGRPYLKLIEDVEVLVDREKSVFHMRAFERTESPATGVLERLEGIAARWRLHEAQVAARGALEVEEAGT